MRFQAAGRVLLGLALTGALALPASAQTKPAASSSSGGAAVNASGGFAFYHETGINAPGFYFGVNSTRRVGFAAEVDGLFTTVSGVSLKLWVFEGGPRFTGRSGAARPYAQVLVGGGRATGSSGTTSVSLSGFVIAPGAGVDIMPAGSRVGMRAQGSLQLAHTAGSWGRALLFGVGIVF